MIEPILIISFIVMAVWFSMLRGEILHKLAHWLAGKLPFQLYNPLFDCPVCMTPWYGSLAYVLIYGVNWQWPVVILAAMGLNVVIVKLWPDKDN